MPGIFQRLGGFASKVISVIREQGRTIGEAVGFLKPMVPTVTEQEVAVQYGRVAVEEQYKGDVVGLNPRSVIPLSLHVETDIPFMRPYAYKAVVFGRFVAGTVRDGKKVGGQFAHEEYNLTTSRQLTKEEIIDMAKGRIGKQGGSPILEIFSIEVVAAYSREDIEI